MRRGQLVGLLALLLMVGANAPPEPMTPEARHLINAYLAASAATADATYRLEKTERMRNGEVLTETLRIKLRTQPYSVYVKRIKPNGGMEAIYEPDHNDGLIRAHMAAFPWSAMNLAPHSARAMNDEHHSIDEVGFDDAARRLHRAIQLAQRGVVTIANEGVRVVGGIHAPCIDIFADAAGNRTIVARQGETLFDVAARIHSWPYLLYLHNPHIRSITDELIAGTRIEVPGFYASRAELCFDPHTHLLIKETYWDAMGVYERYVVKDLRVNVGLGDAAFDPHNPTYDF